MQGTVPELNLEFPSLVSSTPPGRLCVRDVGPRWNQHLWGPVNRRRPVRHQDDSPQKEEQSQAPEEEDQTTGPSLQGLFLIDNRASFKDFFSSSQQTGETGSSSQDQAMLLADSSEDEF